MCWLRFFLLLLFLFASLDLVARFCLFSFSDFQLFLFLCCLVWAATLFFCSAAGAAMLLLLFLLVSLVRYGAQIESSVRYRDYDAFAWHFSTSFYLRCVFFSHFAQQEKWLELLFALLFCCSFAMTKHNFSLSIFFPQIDTNESNARIDCQLNYPKRQKRIINKQTF